MRVREERVVRAVSSLRQVVLLCPTTVLSDQHYITAKERLEPLGVSVALLSRFQTKKEQLFVLRGLLSGSINFVVGTHRLLSDDVVVPSLGYIHGVRCFLDRHPPVAHGFLDSTHLRLSFISCDIE